LHFTLNIRCALRSVLCPGRGLRFKLKTFVLYFSATLVPRHAAQVAGVGGPSNVFVTQGEAREGDLSAGLPLDDARCSPLLRGGNGPSGGKIRRDLYSLPSPHGESFRCDRIVCIHTAHAFA
jgi:hypothetical protein